LQKSKKTANKIKTRANTGKKEEEEKAKINLHIKKALRKKLQGTIYVITMAHCKTIKYLNG
jgi:hypothetical protein